MHVICIYTKPRGKVPPGRVPQKRTFKNCTICMYIPERARKLSICKVNKVQSKAPKKHGEIPRTKPRNRVHLPSGTPPAHAQTASRLRAFVPQTGQALKELPCPVDRDPGTGTGSEGSHVCFAPTESQTTAPHACCVLRAAWAEFSARLISFT